MIILPQDDRYDEKGKLDNCRRQFTEARRGRREEEAAAEEGTKASAGRVTVPSDIPDNVIWTSSEGKEFVRIEGFRTVMVFKVRKQSCDKVASKFQ